MADMRKSQFTIHLSRASGSPRDELGGGSPEYAIANCNVHGEMSSEVRWDATPSVRTDSIEGR